MHYTIIYEGSDEGEQASAGAGSPDGDEGTGHVERPYDLSRDGDGHIQLVGEHGSQRIDVRYLPDGDVHLLVGNRSYDISVGLDRHEAICSWLGTTFGLQIYNDRQLRILRLEEASSGGFQPNVDSPMAGKVIAVKVAQGDVVEENDALVIVEAMKMENIIRAEQAGRVERLTVSEGEAVEVGQTLVVLAPLE